MAPKGPKREATTDGEPTSPLTATKPDLEQQNSSDRVSSSNAVPTRKTNDTKSSRQPGFPAHNAPRVWFITSAASPIGIALSRRLLEHGDYVVAGALPTELERDAPPHPPTTPDTEPSLASISPNATDFHHFLDSLPPAQKRNLRILPLDTRILSQCQSAVAEATTLFGRIDILFACSSETVIGTVEELSSSPASLTAVRAQFETNFFGGVHAIKAVLPTFRAQRNGHLIVLTGITGHLGTPGLGLYCASQWALEGYCDSLAYEVAPFNIRTTIVQPNVEVGVLTNKVVAPPPMQSYGGEANGAPLFRDILSGLLDRLEGHDPANEGGSVGDGSEVDGMAGPVTGDLLHQDRGVSLYPPVGRELKERLVAETVHAVVSIGGHDNPPSRHIVGHEGVTSVKEKLKTVSEEMEDFVEASAAVDL